MKNDILLGKVPPHDLEAEQAVLTAILINNDYLSDVAEIVSPGDFYKTSHQLIFEAFLQISQKKQPVDLITVCDFLKTSGKIDDVGGFFYLVQITEMPMSINPYHHANIILEKSNLRKIINTSANIITQCFDMTKESVEIVDQAQKEIMAIGKTKAAFIDMKTQTDITIDRYNEQARKSEMGITPGLPFGFRELDYITGGLNGSKMVVIAARPSMGKTAFALNIMRTMCRFGHLVGFFSLEQSIEDIEDRFFALETGLNTMRLSQGHGPENGSWDLIMKAADKKSKWRLLIDDSGKMHINELKRRCRLMKNAGCEIIFIDQLSFITGDSRKNQFMIATEATQEIAGLKKELKIPIVLLAQLNRDLEKRDNKEPRLSDLKNSGSLEEDSDLIIFIHRQYRFSNDESEKEDTVINIAKNRNGATWRSTNIKYYEKTTKFEDGER